MKLILKLFISFFKIGLFTFGGGYAMLPMFERELVEKHTWVTNEEMLEYFAIAQCTPGVIAVNTATFVGYKKKKFFGVIAANLGVILPSLIIIVSIATLLKSFSHIPAVEHAFAGIRVAVGALIIKSVVKLMKSNVKKAFQVFLCIVAFVFVAFLGQSPVYVVIASAIFGLFAGKWGDRK
ncbi:MAG TPA: chromate transporter [Clostridia bacterium]|nr:chromate transporter [Clostridia bacterium]